MRELLKDRVFSRNNGIYYSVVIELGRQDKCGDKGLKCQDRARYLTDNYY